MEWRRLRSLLLSVLLTTKAVSRKTAERWRVAINKSGSHEPFSHSDVYWGDDRCSGFKLGVGMALPGR